MSRHCPDCGGKSAWRLADGRWKCRRCGRRYRYRAAWDALRISARDKTRLLEFFVLGVPAYRLRFRVDLAAPTVEKFYRTARSVMALQEGCLDLVPEAEGGSRSRGQHLRVCLERAGDRVRILPPEVLESGPVAGLEGGGTAAGRALLELRHDGHLIHRRNGITASGRQADGIETFWSYASHWLHPYRGVPLKSMPLFLGEICYRFNHRDQDLFPLLNKLLRATPLDRLRPLRGPDSL